MVTVENANHNLNRRGKLSFILGVLILILLFGYAVFKITPPIDSDPQKIKVITTLFPLYDFAKNIGQDKIEVYLLLPPGVEAHAFEPKPSDLAKINEADIFIYTGKFMEPWVEDILKSIANQDLIIIDASQSAQMITGVFNDKNEPIGLIDPHIWLDFDNDKMIVETITKALSARDPNNSDYYKQQAIDYQNKLIALDAEYRISLANCLSREIIYGGHYAFGYLANCYQLKYLAAQGVSPDSEPTAQDLIRLVEQIKKNDIKYIFYEELTTAKIAETLTEETETKMLLLNAAHNITKTDFENGISFFDIMAENLANLKIGLQCQK